MKIIQDISDVSNEDIANMVSAVTTAAVDYLAMVYGISFGKSSSLHKERNAPTIAQFDYRLLNSFQLSTSTS